MSLAVVQLGPYPPPMGGMQTHLVALRQYLRDRGVPCAVINLWYPRRSADDGVYSPRSALGVARLLVQLPHPIIHVHLGGTLTRRLVGLLFVCSLLPRRRTVVTLHDGGYPSSPAGRTAHRRTLRGVVFRRLHTVIAVNSAIVELFERLGIDPNRVRRISPFALPEPGPATALPDRLHAFFTAHRPVIVTISQLEPHYDVPLQLQVFGRVVERFPRAGLVILGSGSQENDLRAAIRATPYADNVLLFGDAPHCVALRAIADGDLLLRTTWYDGDSLAVREALHLGTPVIASDNGMRPEGVSLVPPRDPTALFEAITHCVERGWSRPRRLAGADDNLRALLDLYTELADELAIQSRAESPRAGAGR